MKDNSSVTFCGVHCGACSWQRGGEDGRHLTERAKTLDPKELEFWTSCPGCGAGEHRADCDFRICAKAKGMDRCLDCDDFPCKLHKDFNSDGVAHHANSIASLKFLKENGGDAWLEMQEKKWSCACGAKLSWYQQKCFKCGKEASPLKRR